MATSIIYFLLFFLPLLVVPFGYSYFEPPKVICAQTLIEVLLFIQLSKGKLRIFQRRFIPLALLFTLTIIDLIFMRTDTSFWGNIFRLQGVFLLWNLMAFALISSQVRLPKIPIFVYLIPLFGLFLSCFILGKNDIGRSFGTLGEPNALAASVIFLLPFIFFCLKSKIIRAFSIFIILWVILLSGSRAGLVAFGLQVLFLALSKYISLKKVVVVCLITLTLALTLPFIEGGGWYENRAEVWTSALAAGTFHPILGAGFGNSEHAILQISKLLENNVRYQYVDSSHNFLLDFWIQGGLVGVSLICFLLFKTFKNFVLERKKLELTAFLGLITVMLFNPVSVVTLVAFWWLIGQGFDKQSANTVES